MISKLTIGSLMVALSSGGKCPFGYGSKDSGQQEVVQLNDLTADSALLGMNTTKDDDDDDSADKKDQDEELYPADVLKCPTQPIMVTDSKWGKHEYEDMFTVMSAHLEQFPTKDHGPLAACLVRLAGHDFMDFRWSSTKTKTTSSGGSDGCMNFKDPSHAGLPRCLKQFKIPKLYERYCTTISLADFIVITAEMIMGRLATSHNPTDPFSEGTLASRFRDQLYVGRQTVEKCPNNIGLMPNPENGCDDLQKVFVDHIYNQHGFNWWKKWINTAAISGAHTLGQAHKENSGYEGAWSTPEDQGKFNNGYYKNMLMHGWGPQRNVGGNPNKTQWERIDQLPCNSGTKEMMLSSDLCLAYQFNTQHADCMKKQNRKINNCNKFQKKGRFLNAKTDSCCAWTMSHILSHKRFGPVMQVPPNGKNDYCGINAINGDLRGICCQHERSDSIGDCDAANWPKGKMFDFILQWAGNEEKFYTNFLQAWKVATMNGFPKPLWKVMK